jgi:hypothetical protein
MNEHYYGRIGKEKGFGLLADKRIVVYKKQKMGAEFIPVDTIAEAEALDPNIPEDTIYFWDNGDWQEVDFLVESDKRKTAVGFSPR